jgi:surface antigen
MNAMRVIAVLTVAWATNLALGFVSVRSVTATPSNARFIELGHNTNGGDNRLDVILTVKTGTPRSACEGKIWLLSRTRPLPSLRTSSKGGGQWRWEIATDAPGGLLTARVRCTVDHQSVRRTTVFEVRAGPQPSRFFRRIDAVGTMNPGFWTPPNTKNGSGQGGPSLYPPGQCTGFVARLRPDLPFFPDATGDAKNWAVSAADAGWIVNQTPSIGAVAVFKPGQYGAGYMGHVAYVTAVLGDRIEVLDRNWRGNGATLRRKTRWSGIDFIHARAPQPIEPSPSVPPANPPPVTPAITLISETTGGYTHTWSDYLTAGGMAGPIIPPYVSVEIACKVIGFAVENGNRWWYRIASEAWGGTFYASADAFYNNGQTTGSLVGTSYVDPAVPNC